MTINRFSNHPCVNLCTFRTKGNRREFIVSPLRLCTHGTMQYLISRHASSIGVLHFKHVWANIDRRSRLEYIQVKNEPLVRTIAAMARESRYYQLVFEGTEFTNDEKFEGEKYLLRRAKVLYDCHRWAGRKSSSWWTRCTRSFQMHDTGYFLDSNTEQDRLNKLLDTVWEVPFVYSFSPRMNRTKRRRNNAIARRSECEEKEQISNVRECRHIGRCL